VAAVKSELYKLQTVDVIAVESAGKSPKDTGQLDRYCMPVSGMSGIPPPRKGMILVPS
jgi:hypothetical protein